MTRLKVIPLLFLATLFAPAFAQGAHPAGPGTINYVEGSASIDGRAITSRSVGNTALGEGGTLSTAKGKVEVLLTPGVFLRVDDESTVRMISPSVTHTEVQIQRGRALVEVNQLSPQDNIQIDLKNGQAVLVKRGLYEFDVEKHRLRVFEGMAAAYEGNAPQSESEAIVVKDGQQLALTGEPSKPQRFTKNTTDALYRWSSQRSEYLAEANEGLAERYAGSYDDHGAYPNGWVWAPGFYGYTWLPWNGYFYSPFDFGYYSPWWYGWGWGWGGYGGYGYWGHGYRGGYGYRGGLPGRPGVGRPGGPGVGRPGGGRPGGGGVGRPGGGGGGRPGGGGGGSGSRGGGSHSSGGGGHR